MTTDETAATAANALERQLRAGLKALGVNALVGQDPCIHWASPSRRIHISVCLDDLPALVAGLPSEADR